MRLFPGRPRSFFVLAMLLMLVLTIGSNVATYGKAGEDSHFPASLTGVHHLGPDYVIYRFWVNKRIGDNIGRGGGGGSSVCCVSVPKKWNSELTADIRWEVGRIVKSVDPAKKEILETEGIYRATVPIEPYIESGNFYVHFFPEGRARVVISAISSDGEQHPVQGGDLNGGNKATTGKAVEEMLTKEDLDELRREIAHDRKKYGDWK